MAPTVNKKSTTSGVLGPLKGHLQRSISHFIKAGVLLSLIKSEDVANLTSITKNLEVAAERLAALHKRSVRQEEVCIVGEVINLAQTEEEEIAPDPAVEDVPTDPAIEDALKGVITAEDHPYTPIDAHDFDLDLLDVEFIEESTGGDNTVVAAVGNHNPDGGVEGPTVEDHATAVSKNVDDVDVQYVKLMEWLNAEVGEVSGVAPIKDITDWLEKDVPENYTAPGETLVSGVRGPTKIDLVELIDTPEMRLCWVKRNNVEQFF